MVWLKKENRVLLAVLLIVLLLISATACSAKNETVQEEEYQTADDVEMAQPEEELLPPVEIKMPDYELEYAGEMKDVILVKETDDGTGLAFSVQLSTGEMPIFTLRYNTDEGELVTVLENAKGERIPVAFEMAAVPDGMSDEDSNVFYAAQEAVNDIVSSLKLK